MGFARKMRRKRDAGMKPELLTGKPGDVRKCPRDQNVLNVVYMEGDEDGERVGMICPRCGGLYEERVDLSGEETSTEQVP